MSRESIHTEAVILHYIDYADNSIIVRLYTQTHGLLSCIAKGVKTKPKKGTNKMSCFLPLNIVDTVIYYQQDKELHLLSEIHSIWYHQTLHTDIKKMAYTSFLAEFLLRVLHEEDQPDLLFSFLKEKIIRLDQQSDKLLNLYFHILLNVCGYLGYKPDLATWHSLLDVDEVSIASFLTEIYANPDYDYTLSDKEKKVALSVTERFMQMHIQGFKPLQSTTIWSLIY
jgi:DNA repair protein RecO (recombination protein O)